MKDKASNISILLVSVIFLSALILKLGWQDNPKNTTENIQLLLAKLTKTTK
jgi:hypothetical protein